MTKDRIFDWEKYSAWRPVVLSALTPWIGPDVFEWLKANPPRGFYADNLDWLNNAIAEERGEVVEIKEVLANKLPECFQFVRAFHGTRALSEDTFREHGILAASCDWMRQHARERVDPETFAKAEKELTGDFLGLCKGRVHFCLCASELLENAGHYLVYGSESLQGIFGQRKLRNYGRPMLIECRVPTAAIEWVFLDGLAGTLLREIAEKYCTRQFQRNTGFGFRINESLAPGNIIKIHYPKRIRDQHAGGYWEG